MYVRTLQAKKLNGSAERKKSDEREHKFTESEKIVDMPLITSTNMIAIVSRRVGQGATDAGSVDAEKAAETAAATPRRCSEICKSEKRNASLPRNSVPMAKEAEVESPATSARFARTTTTAVGSECARREEEEARGVELVLTPLTREETSSESDDPGPGPGGEEDVDVGGAASRVRREVEGATKESRSFCFENSRELAGEPDGKADEGVLTEPLSPPALPACPPPIAVTEPRSSFLHGATVNGGESRATKPAVPQKPVTLPAKVGCTSEPPPAAVRKVATGDYVLPPPSVQNAAVRAAQCSGKERAGETPASEARRNELRPRRE